MIEKERALSHINDIDLKNELKKIIDIYLKSKKEYSIKNTRFVTPNIVKHIVSILGFDRDIIIESKSLNDNPERVIIYFYPDFFEGTIEYKELSIVKIIPSRYNLNHRDYLGSILSLGIDRSNIGDILVDEDNSAYVVVLKPIDIFLQMNLKKVKNNNVDIYIEENIPNITLKFSEYNINISSMRLDAIVSKLINESRDTSQNIVKRGDVKLNFEVEKRISVGISKDDVISIRGYGKYIITGEEKRTKKDRIVLKIRKYIS